jgi:hypothetical protein
VPIAAPTRVSLALNPGYATYATHATHATHAIHATHALHANRAATVDDPQ